MHPYATHSAITGNARQNPESLEQCGVALVDQISRLRNAVQEARELADRLGGSMPEEKAPPNGPKPVCNGLVENFCMTLSDLDSVINEIQHHHGRISRAIAAG